MSIAVNGLAERTASMGPPREHGGVIDQEIQSQRARFASMGPPRERGGVVRRTTRLTPRSPLQWGRRANTAEWGLACCRPRRQPTASMGPPREHGGVPEGVRHELCELQVASMGPPREHGGVSRSCSPAAGWPFSFNGAAARTRRSELARIVELNRMLTLQWGRRANTAECRTRTAT